MWKKTAALLLSVLLAAQLAAPPARASENVYFVAAGGNVLPLSDSTMPFWSGGYLYVAASIFTGIVWNTLGISNTSSKTGVILYSRDNRPLLFDLSKNYAQDNNGNTYYPGAVKRNGIVFVPASVVASFFGLQYSLIPDVDHGYLVWLRKPDFGLSDKEFANAAAYSMAECYAQYQRGRQEVPAETPGQTAPETPAESGKKRIYLCFRADSSAGALLDALDRYEAKAAFFCSQDFLESQGDLLRRMCAGGHSIGLLVDGGDRERSLEEQLAAGNEALYRATCTKTRLARVENGDQTAAENTGFRCFLPDLDRSGYDLRSASNAASLFQRVSSRRDGVTVWLADTAGAVGLRAFLAAAEQAEDRLLAWTETA